MIKKMTVTTLALLLSSSAMAQVVGGIGYYNFDDEGSDIDLAIVTATIGYKFSSENSNFSMTPELRAGAGVKDDTYLGVNVKISQAYGLNVRGQWDFNNATYFFIAPSYMNFELEASAGGFKASEDDWQFGGGAGVGFKFSDNGGVELSYEKFNDAEVLGLGVRFGF